LGSQIFEKEIRDRHEIIAMYLDLKTTASTTTKVRDRVWGALVVAESLVKIYDLIKENNVILKLN